MKPLICPQCGGKITDYNPSDIFTICSYCETRFVIDREQPKPPPATPEYKYEPFKNSLSSGQITGIVLIVFAFVIGGIFLFSASKKEKVEPIYNYGGYSKTPTPTPTASPSPTPNPNLLEFGGKGTGEGLFKDADSIAVDKKGRIYVGDDSLRVQQFDENGKFLKLWQIPSEGKIYKGARTIHKIAVDADENLYVAIGGVILVYRQTVDEPFLTMHDAPDYVMDFALRKDGGVLLISNNDEIETLFFVGKNRKILRSIKGFHTETANAVMQPAETGLAAIRIAVDGAGNIFSIYAFGDLGSYQLTYNSEDFRIFRFNPEGKYVDKFVQTMTSVGIETDNQSRIYVSNEDAIEIYSNEGEQLSTISGLKRLNAFALDQQNNIYVLIDDRVVKRAGI